MATTSSKKIMVGVIEERYPHLKTFQGDILDVTTDTFSEIAAEVQEGNTVLVKNFGSFKLKERTPRARFDQGIKEVVITPPKETVQFTQSPNVFRDVQEEEN